MAAVTHRHGALGRVLFGDGDSSIYVGPFSMRVLHGTSLGESFFILFLDHEDNMTTKVLPHESKREICSRAVLAKMLGRVSSLGEAPLTLTLTVYMADAQI